MDFTNPPQDIELKNIIDKLAQFVARNGPEFEEMTKNKQKGNPKFDFLFGGEYYPYYRFKVNNEQAYMNAELNNSMHNSTSTPVPPSNLPTNPPWMNQNQNNLQTESLTAQQVALNDQIRESETNLNAQHEVMLQQQQIQIEDTIAKAQENDLKKDAIDCGIDFGEFDNVLQPIIDTCTKDAISAGKSWIIQRATAPTPNSVIAHYLLRKVVDSTATFNRRLHIIYLLNDTLHHCLRKNADELKKALEDVVVPMFCTTALNVSDEQLQKLQKLLNLWENKNHYFSKEIIEKLKNPSDSLKEYKAKLLDDYSKLVEQIISTNKSTYQHYQSQHQAFVNHALQQIQSLEKQKQAFEQQKQQMAQSIPHPPIPVPMQSPMNNLQNDMTRQIESKTREIPQHMRTPTQQSPIPSLMQQHISPPASYDSRPNSTHTPLTPTKCNRQELGLSDRLPHHIQNHDPRLQNSQFRNQNSDSFHQPVLPNTQEPPPPPISSFKQDSSFNHVSSTFADLPASDGNIPPPSSQHPFNQPPPGFPQPPLTFPPPDVALPDLSRPPPNFANNGTPAIPNIPPLMSLPPPDFIPDDLLPSLPYYDLPAGLMVPLVKLEDSGYKPLNPDDIRLPPPAPPSERLLAAVKAFYTPPGHDRPRDSEGWEKLGLYEYYRAKSIAKQQKIEDIQSGKRAKSRSASPIVRQKSRSRSPPLNRKRYRSRSRSKSKGRGSRSPPRNRSSNNRRSSPARRSNRDRGRDRSRSRSSSPYQDIQRSPTPPSFMNSSYGKTNDKLDESNKGHQLLKKMGWGGAGLGAKEQGIEAPINAGEIRDRTDQYKGVGINLSDPYENFRKSKGQAFITRMKERAEERLANTG